MHKAITRHDFTNCKCGLWGAAGMDAESHLRRGLLEAKKPGIKSPTDAIDRIGWCGFFRGNAVG